MNNPEFRQTLHNISHNLENANQTAQENIYTFTQLYIDPCIGGIKSGLYSCTAPCFPNREDNLRRKRGRPRGRPEYNFDFYDAWDDDAETNDAALTWGNDELDSLLAGRGVQSTQPKRQRAMSYGSRGRRKPTLGQADTEQDPTIIPSSSYLGFLERLPWRIGSRNLRYKPSAADLQEHPGGLKARNSEAEPLIEEQEEEQERRTNGHGRSRSDTMNSRSTTNSLSSRGDLIMSDEEDDAVPLDDEFAVALGRRMTGQGVSEDQSSGKSRTPNGKRPGGSRRTTRTTSSKSFKSPSSKSQRSPSQQSLAPISPVSVDKEHEPPTLLDLKRQEEQIEREEELEIQQKREAAHQLALERGLKWTVVDIAEGKAASNTSEDRHSIAATTVDSSDRSNQQCEPFPDIISPSLSKDNSQDDKGST